MHILGARIVPNGELNLDGSGIFVLMFHALSQFPQVFDDFSVWIMRKRSVKNHVFADRYNAFSPGVGHGRIVYGYADLIGSNGRIRARAVGHRR